MYNVKIDKFDYKSKPTEFGVINNRLISCKAECVTWSDFCDLVGNQGHAFLATDFHSSKRNKGNFKSQQIFALDFDGTVSFGEVSQIAERYGIPIALAYLTEKDRTKKKVNNIIKTFKITDSLLNISKEELSNVFLK